MIIEFGRIHVVVVLQRVLHEEEEDSPCSLNFSDSSSSVGSRENNIAVGSEALITRVGCFNE
jgi:hypothetical protein